MPKPKARRITAEEEEIAGKLNKTYERLRPDKANLEAQCQEIADRFWPSQSRLFMNQDQGMVHGEKRGEEVFDSTPCVALNKGAAILDSLLTPANSVWHQMACDVPELMNDRETQLWLEELNRAIFRKRYAPTANFVSQNQLVYKGELAYGTSALFTDEFRGRRGEKGYRYKNIHLSELLILENHQGIVDEVIRYYKASAGNIVERFPRTCPEFIRKKAEKYPEHKYYLLHWVKPREKVDYDRADHLGMEWVSCYATMEQKCFLEEGGYTSMPYAVGRYELVPGEPWARSPAMDVLAAVKTMNEMKRTILTHGQKAVAPPLFAYDDGVLDVANIRSGAFNSGGVSSDGKMLVHSMPVGNIMLGKELLDDERKIIEDPFMVPLFQLLEENPQMTATEVVERLKDRNVVLSPTVGRQYSEYHSKVIDREIDLELSQNEDLFNRMPESFAQYGAQYRLRYESPMARMQRAEEASGFMRTIETALKIATEAQNPAPLDHFNWDVIIPELSDIGGVPKRWLNDPKIIQQIREGRAQQSETDQAIQAGPAQAALIKANAVQNKAA